MTDKHDSTIHVVGGGLVGPLAAVLLAQKGYDVALHERRPDMRKVEMAAGRSINLAVTARGLEALDRAGLRDRVMEIAIPMKGRMLHDENGDTTLVPYGQKDDEVIYAADRGLLNKLLLAAADEHDNVKLFFNRRCEGYELESGKVTFLNNETDQQESFKPGVVIGADGAWSALRKSMLENLFNFNYQQDFLEHGYKELVIPPGEGGSFLMEKNALHIWPRKNFMLIALPNTDGSFTCTLFLPYKGDVSFEKLKTEEAVTRFFETCFPDAVPLMPTLLDDFFINPTGALATIKCSPWHVDGKMLLLGDASHAIVPFFGQGMNCGFEDCSELADRLPDAGGSVNWETLFTEIEAARKPNTDAIADMAVENFVEMRDSVADPQFQLKKQVGFELEKRWPEKFIPRYSMVIFHPEIPYAEARRRSEAQAVLLDELCAGISGPDEVDWNKAEKLVSAL